MKKHKIEYHLKKLSKCRKLLKQLRRDGVTIIDPDTVYVKGEISIGRGTVVNPCVFLTNVRIGEDCIIGPVTEIIDSQIGDRVEGLFTAQIKRSKLDNGCKMHHHGYVGDTEVDRKVNISAGAITCNYDGKNKHKTVLGDGVFVGSNVNLIAPIRIEQGCYIAAGSTIVSGEYKEKNKLMICREKLMAIKALKK
jgi:bifunctional UDP-N-acetylglucosamine pyrophosphorylase/glucosamine-1-phosphate N-acetyltransferase